MVEGSGGKHRQRQSRVNRRRRGGGHRAVTATDRQHFGLCGRLAQHPLRVVARGQFDDPRIRQARTHLVDDLGPGAAARCRVDHQDHSGTVGPLRCLHPERFRFGQRRLDNRWDQPAAQHGNAGTNAESGRHIAGIVHPGRHPRQPDQRGQHRKA
ncbi:hypothetical protein OSJ78_21670 [Mycobacterium ulcerans]